MLPRSIQEHIENLLASAAEPKSKLIKARERLTNRYINFKTARGFESYDEALAYIAARLPATFAAVEFVISYTPLENVASVLDLGAGPGTATLAAALQWPECKQFRLVDENPWMQEISQHLLQELPESQNRKYIFENKNLISYENEFPHEVVFLSYVLNELPIHEQVKVLQKAWNWTAKALVIIVPGTPKDYKNLMQLRDYLISAGAFITAPCPHHNKCPLMSDDWCHFSTRLIRSSFHRKIKNVELPYEDEKFSYLVAMRESGPRPKSRIIRKPIQRSGHVTFDLCTSNGLERKTISRREKDVYKKALNATWGDGGNDF